METRYKRQELSQEEIYELRSRKAFMIQHRWLQNFKEDSEEYISAFEGAIILQPYIAKYMEEGKLTCFVDLSEGD